MATNLTGNTIATTYEKLVKRQDSYSSTGNRIEIQNDSAASLDTALYLDVVNQRVGIGTAAPSEILHIREDVAGTMGMFIHNDANNAAADVFITLQGNQGSGTITNGQFGYDRGDDCVYIGHDENKEIALKDGKVGIGTGAPPFTLTLDDNERFGWEFGSNGDSRSWGFINDGTHQGTLNLTCSSHQDNDLDTEIMAWDDNGNVGINETAPSFKLDITGTANTTTIVRCTTPAVTSDNTSTFFQAICTPSSGNTAITEIGSTFNTATATAGSCSFIRMGTSDNVTHYIWASEDDDLRASTDGNHVGTANGTKIGDMTTSDERLKNISKKAFPYGLDEINKLTPIKYSMKKDKEKKLQLGFGAQTTKPIIPEVVIDTKECIDGHRTIDGFDDDGNPTREHIANSDCEDSTLVMSYNGIIPVLVKAVQELSAKVTALENA